MVDTVTGTIVEAGDIPVADGDAMYTYERALVIQFDTADDLRAALTGTKQIRGEWQVPTGDTK